MGLSDEQIRQQVVDLFKYYEGDQSGYIEKEQKDRFIHNLKLEIRVKRKDMKETDLSLILGSLDKATSGRITKDEVFVVLKQLNSQ